MNRRVTTGVIRNRRARFTYRVRGMVTRTILVFAVDDWAPFH